MAAMAYTIEQCETMAREGRVTVRDGQAVLNGTLVRDDRTSEALKCALFFALAEAAQRREAFVARARSRRVWARWA